MPVASEARRENKREPVDRGVNAIFLCSQLPHTLKMVIDPNTVGLLQGRL